MTKKRIQLVLEKIVSASIAKFSTNGCIQIRLVKSMAKCEKCDCCDASLDIEEQSYWSGKSSGTKSERQRILALITNYWCGEENCRKHGTDWEAFIKEIENGNK